MIIDAHHHLAKQPLCSYTETYVDAIEEIAAQFSIESICMVGLGESSPHFAGNAEVLALHRRCPRVLPFAYLDLDRDPPVRVGEYVRQGFRGCKVIGTRRSLNSEPYLPLYEAIAATGQPVLVHTGYLYGTLLHFFDNADFRPVLLDPVARRFPTMPIICAHAGSPWTDEGITLAHYHENFYLDFTGNPITRDPEWFKLRNYDIRWERVVFGTDSMIKDFHFSHDRHLRLMKHLGLPTDQQAAVMGGTMRSLLNPKLREDLAE